ncbi:MAG: 2-oxoglutarate dehydrogenase complex dihydrolipoyllysine-residue succinyltransferase, partial [Sedimenticola sp.]|nr:2-oxoglutarate dehydrogenase complex dihydrolipoyllysine-residue succinyltransferase [Sedimenticola sp.]
MSTKVTVPALPESVADATILSWHKKPGDPVSRDENLVDLETDKVVLEVPSPVDGIMGAISAAEGETVVAGDLLTIIQEGAVQAQAPAADTAESSADEEPILTPAVRRLVKEKGIDPKEIVGTGKDGRILKTDVTAYIESLEASSSKSAAPMPQESEITQSGVEGDRPEQRVPMTRLRARIAERLLEAQQNAAILTTFNEVDLQAINELRKNYKDKFEKDHEVKLGFMSFFIKAAVEALKQFPAVNASVDGKDIIYHGYYDIGIAVGSPRGLVVPILRDADQLGFADTEKAVRDFGKKANDGSLSYEELTGGTFTISNGGVFGSMLSTPILNPPQSAILGMHTIQQRPMVVNGEIVIRPMMYLALSYDHR